MLKDDTIVQRVIKFPIDLSSEEKERILERARYETFTQPGVSARAIFYDLATALLVLAVVIAVNAGLFLYTPLRGIESIYQALASALVLGVALVFLQIAHQYHRARIIAPKAKEILEQQQIDSR